MCKNLNHVIKRVNVKKRFFECKKCKNRTFSFNKLPKTSCSNCGESKWERTGMMRERKGPLLDSEKLLIRGQERSFVGASVKSSELSLDSIQWFWYAVAIPRFDVWQFSMILPKCMRFNFCHMLQGVLKRLECWLAFPPCLLGSCLFFYGFYSLTHFNLLLFVITQFNYISKKNMPNELVVAQLMVTI